LRWEYLTEDCAYRTVTDDLDDLYIVGVNGSNKEKTRKVVWAGRLSAVMTFAEAYTRLNGTRFRKLRASANSPLHVRPVMKDGILIGYEHRSDEHIDNDDWVSDLTSTWRDIRVEGRRLVIEHGATAWNA